MFASISHDTHGWGMVQNLQSLPRTHKYPLIFPFYVHIHTCMHTYKNGYSPQMLFHLPECACLLAGPGHGQLQRDGFLTLLFKVYAIQRWVKATKNGSFATSLQETPNLSINWEALAAQAPVPAGTGPDKGADGKIFLNSRHDKFSDPNGEP